MPSVLVIDDSRMVAQKVQHILDPYGIDTYHAATVAEVFGFQGKPSMLRDYLPDVILLDIMMPDMNGFDTLQKLQSMVKMRDVPVMMFSASSSEHTVIEAMHRGAKAFIAKPLDRERLLAEMARVGKESNSRALVRQLSSYLPSGVKAENEREDLNVGDVNLSYLLEIIDGDEELLRQLVEVFVEDMPVQISGMESAIAAEKATELGLAAHLFKGSVSNFGAVLITDKALQLEIKGRAGDLKGTPALFADLKKDADELYKQLIDWLAF